MLPLTELLQAAGDAIIAPSGAAQLDITGLCVDSRQAAKGCLFFALKGARADGGRFIAQAGAAGAVAIVCDVDTGVDESDMAVVRSPNPRLAMARMAARFYARQPKHMVAVTGTDGKTSTADFFRQIAHHTGHSSASIGTLGILTGAGETLFPGTHTTPDSIELHRLLAELAGRGVEYLGMEASSHGLHQHRLDGVALSAAGFTNIARDHLDYHHTEEAYFHAKLRLFDSLLPKGATAVVNQDDARFDAIRQVCRQRGHEVIGFGRNGGQFRINGLTPLPHGQTADLTLMGRQQLVDIPLVGAFQVMNILTALGLWVGTGGDLDKAVGVIGRFAGVPGRLELVAQLANGAAVFVDYAHTPMALANILKTLRPHTQGRLHTVFGCGGDRDAGKRPEMGRIADELADCAIVTDDNPRSEVPASIRAAIMAATGRAKEVADRKEAIYVAIEHLGPGDILVIAGKGHEKVQIVGDTTYPFDDADVARRAAIELKVCA